MDPRKTETTEDHGQEPLTVTDRAVGFLTRHLVETDQVGNVSIGSTVILRFCDLILLKNAAEDVATGNYFMASADVVGVGILHSYRRIRDFLGEKLKGIRDNN